MYNGNDVKPRHCKCRNENGNVLAAQEKSAGAMSSTRVQRAGDADGGTEDWLKKYLCRLTTWN